MSCSTQQIGGGKPAIRGRRIMVKNLLEIVAGLPTD